MEPKDLLIRKTSIKTNISEDTVRDIVNFQWKYCLEQVKTDATSIEIAELGIFKFSPTKAKKKMVYMDSKLREWENYLQQENPYNSVIVQNYIEEFQKKKSVIESKLNKHE